jgi:hypothetical protein
MTHIVDFESITSVDKEIRRVVRRYTQGYRTLSQINGRPVILVSRTSKIGMVKLLFSVYGLTDELADNLLRDVQLTNKAMPPSEITPLLRYCLRMNPGRITEGTE